MYIKLLQLKLLLIHLKKLYTKYIRSGCFNMVIFAREVTPLGSLYSVCMSHFLKSHRDDSTLKHCHEYSSLILTILVAVS